MNFVAQPGGQPNAQQVAVTFNGAPTAINSFSFTPTSGGGLFVNTTISGSIATLTDNTNLIQGIYTGIETLFTVFGSVNVPVTLTIGSGGGNLVFTPNPVAFSVQTGGSVPSQNVTVLANNTSAHVTGVSASTTTGQNWLLPSVSPSLGFVTVSINAAVLSAGSYTGIVTVNAQEGTGFFQVNLTVCGAPTLVVTPNVLNFAYQVGTANPPSQTIQISSNGSPINYTVSSSTISGGTQWLIVSPLGVLQTTPGSLTVSVQPAGLQTGFTYTGTIQINTFGGASNPTVNIPVSLLVSNNCATS